MEIDAGIQIIVAVALGVLTIVWNQQRSVGNLRREFQEANTRMRQEFQEANKELREAVVRNGERLARIEGHLGIGVAEPGTAAGARTDVTQTQTGEAVHTRHVATG